MIRPADNRLPPRPGRPDWGKVALVLALMVLGLTVLHGVAFG